jgi:hypothetical protein
MIGLGKQSGLHNELKHTSLAMSSVNYGVTAIIFCLLLMPRLGLTAYPAKIVSWYDYGYAPGKLSMPPTGNGRITDWHQTWPGHSDMYLSPSQCYKYKQGLTIKCSVTSCSGGFLCQADLSCPDGSAPNYADGTCPGVINSKNTGKPKCGSQTGNPINTGTGNKFQSETDVQEGGLLPLTFVRSYNSALIALPNSIGTNWQHNYSRTIKVNSSTEAFAVREDASAYSFKLTGSSVTSPTKN